MRIKKKYKIVIDRSKWVNGNSGVGLTCLLNDEGFKCCLGFITQQITRKGIKDIAFPSGCNYSVPVLNVRLASGEYEDTEVSNKAIGINDDTQTTLAQKEAALKELFKNTPISLRFKGKPVDKE